MIRGTTPRLEFTLPFRVDIIEAAYVTFAQAREVVIDKPLTDCECEEEKIICTLTQEETLRLSCGCKTEMQVRIKTKDGESLASDIIEIETERILKDGVI